MSAMGGVFLIMLSIAILNCRVYSASDSCTVEGEVRKMVETRFLDCTGCQSGPLEICQDRVWTLLCDGDWTAADAAVACRSLGLSPDRAMNISLGAGLGNPSRTGVVCTGTEAHLRDCPKGDSNTASSPSSGLTCISGSRVACYPVDSTSGTPTPVETSQQPSTTISSTELEASQPTSPVATTLSTHSTTGDVAPQQNFLSGSGLYIFIGGVGAVVVGIMVLVQILLTCWCCLRYRTKGISPYEMEAQKSRKHQDQLDDSSKMPPTTAAKMRSKNHHQLQQSPPKATNPIFYSAPDGRSPAREPSGVYAELDNSKVYAQIEPFSPSSVPTDPSTAEPTYQSVQQGGDDSYQLLQHKNSIVSKNPRKPRHLGEEQARKRKESLDNTIHEHPQGHLPMGDFAQRQPKLVSPDSDLVRQYATLEESENPERIPSPNLYHTIEAERDNVYHTIEQPPDYATLENPNEPSPRETKERRLVKNNSTESPATPPAIPSRDRAPSKSSITGPHEVHIGSRSSLSSSSSSQSQQGDKSSGESTPLMSRHHTDRSTANSTPTQLTVVNHGPRVTNKYTESPVPSRKGVIVQQQETQKISRQLQESPIIPDPIDTNKLYTLV